jgi:hypothetical protein
MVAMDDNNGDTRKRKLNNNEGMTRDDQGGRARTNGAIDPMMTGMVKTQADKGHKNNKAEDYQDQDSNNVEDRDNNNNNE